MEVPREKGLMMKGVIGAAAAAMAIVGVGCGGTDSTAGQVTEALEEHHSELVADQVVAAKFVETNGVSFDLGEDEGACFAEKLREHAPDTYQALLVDEYDTVSGDLAHYVPTTRWAWECARDAVAEGTASTVKGRGGEPVEMSMVRCLLDELYGEHSAWLEAEYVQLSLAEADGGELDGFDMTLAAADAEIERLKWEIRERCGVVIDN